MNEKKQSLREKRENSVVAARSIPNDEVSNSVKSEDVGHESKAKAAPTLAILAGHVNDSNLKKIRVLEAELEKWDDAAPAKKLDPSVIEPSKWANRHKDSFTSTEFKELKADIESAGGNVQAIKVCPIPGSDPQRFEVVFGHRRHRACLELGLPVLAVIESINEQELFVQMDRENRQRADLRPYEQGMMYRKALDEGLFPSARKLAEVASIDLTNLGKALALARLPDDVLKAFSSPLELQYRWATELTQALQKDPDMVLSNAKNIQSLNPKPPAKEVLKTLITGGSTVLPPAPKIISIKGNAGQTGAIVLDVSDRSAVVTLKNMDPTRFEELKKIIEDFVS
jgi:ParB family chromosome partitioning protein